MAALSTIAATAIGAAGVGASIHAANQGRSAARTAANASQQATDATLDIARDARDATTRELRPFASAGTDALSVIRQMLGLGSEPSALTQQVLSGQPGRAPGSPDFEAYVRNNPDLLEAYQQGTSQIGGAHTGMTMEEFGRQHWMGGQGWGGRNEGRTLPVFGGAQPTTQPAPNPNADVIAVEGGGQNPAGGQPTGFEGSVFSRLVDDAAATFESSPWWQFAQQATSDAVNDLDSRYGASGLLLSGQGLRARAEIAARLRGDAFNQHYNQRTGALSDYMSALMGLTETGFRAASGIGSGGQQFAQTAGNALTNNAMVRGNTAIAGAQAQNQGMADALGFGGWALGQVLNRPPAPQSSTATSLTPLRPMPQFGG